MQFPKIPFFGGMALFFLHAPAFAETVTLAGGRTTGAATKHDYVGFELNLPWKSELWVSENLQLDLNHAFNVSGFRDENRVYAVSWAPNVTLSPRISGKVRPYLQFGFGVALLSDDYFQSEDNDPRHTGTTDMGSHGQFVSSLTIGMTYQKFGVRARIYHYSNANISSTNDGIDVAEFGISYRF